MSSCPDCERRGRVSAAKLFDRPRWRTMEQLRLAIVTLIERTYLRRRRQRGLGRLTPIELEAVHEVALAA
jgi:putative transposase